MTAIIDTLKDENGNTVYPQTKTNAVLDGNGNNVDELLTALNLLVNNKVDKTTENTKIYGTHTDGTQTTIPYSSNGTAWTLAHRNGEGGLNANGYQCRNSKTYAQCFYNNDGNERYCHIGTLKLNDANKLFAGRIYTYQGYGADNNQEIVDYNITAQNNQEIRGFAVAQYNNYTQELKMYLVKTSNNWEWEVYLKMHSWSSALFEVNIPCHDDTNWKFTFDSSDSNFVGYPDNAQLTITPRKLAVINYQAAIDGATGWNSGYVDIPMSNKILRIQYGQENPNDNSNKRVSFPQSYDTLLYAMAALSGTGDTQSQRASITSMTTTYLEFGNVSANSIYVRWIAIGIKNY